MQHYINSETLTNRMITLTDDFNLVAFSKWDL